MTESFTKDAISTSLDYLTDLCLHNDKPQEFTDRDLFNASLVFSHILIDTIWHTNQHLPQEKREELAETTGKAIRELIKVSTGKDMRLIAKGDKIEATV